MAASFHKTYIELIESSINLQSGIESGGDDSVKDIRALQLYSKTLLISLTVNGNVHNIRIDVNRTCTTQVGHIYFGNTNDFIMIIPDEQFILSYKGNLFVITYSNATRRITEIEPRQFPVLEIKQPDNTINIDNLNELENDDEDDDVEDDGMEEDDGYYSLRIFPNSTLTLDSKLDDFENFIENSDYLACQSFDCIVGFVIRNLADDISCGQITRTNYLDLLVLGSSNTCLTYTIHTKDDEITLNVVARNVVVNNNVITISGYEEHTFQKEDVLVHNGTGFILTHRELLKVYQNDDPFTMKFFNEYRNCYQIEWEGGNYITITKWTYNKDSYNAHIPFQCIMEKRSFDHLSIEPTYMDDEN